MSDSEFPRPIDVRQAEGKHVTLEATPAERAALAERLGIVRIDRLAADVTMARKGRTVSAEGRLVADLVQACAVSGEDIAVTIDEPVDLRFVPATKTPLGDIDAELDPDETDEIEYEGTHFDLGEALAQTLALAIDPFLTGPQAEEARRAAGLDKPDTSGPFAALAKLKPAG